MIPAPGTTFAGYRVLSECGKGAYGTVFLAQDALGKPVAIKYMSTTEAGEYELKGLRNYMALPAQQPALLQILHCGLDDGRLFYVMEAADNAADAPDEYRPDTLAERLRDGKRLPANQALALVHALLDGLEVIHDAGMLHRDVKPENIVFVNGVPKLADPGLTRAVDQSISIAGTPGYLAPELLNGVHASPATDLYALGKVLYRAVTGYSPERYPEQPADVPIDELYQICQPLLRLCNTDPAQRCQNCEEARKVLPRRIQKHGRLRRLRDTLALRHDLRKQLLVNTLQMLFCLLPLLSVQTTSNRLHDSKQQLFASARRLEQQTTARQQARLKAQRAKLQDAALKRQLNVLEEAVILSKIDNIEQFQATHDNLANSQYLHALRAEIADIAIRHLPAVPLDDALRWSHAAQLAYYSRSPLASYLPEDKRNALDANLRRCAAHFATAGGPRLGRDFTDYALKDFKFVFLPGGCFHSPAMHSEVNLSYPYWLLATEIGAELFSHVTRMTLPRTSPLQAAEYLTWNDLLLFCRALNDHLAQSHALPPGYAIRPPTEAEWEFAALDGWASTPPAVRAIPTGTTNQPPGSGTPNSLGLFNLDDNLAEVAIPFAEFPAGYPDDAVVRGADYRCEHTGINDRFPYLRDQGHRWGIGLRPALAPTQPDFYATEWYRGPEIRVAELDGAIYAGFVTIQADLTWEAAIQLASDLGAALPDNTDLPRLPELYRQLGLVTDYPCHLAISFRDDEWRDLAADHAVVRHAPATSGSRTALDATARDLVPVAPEMAAPVLILKWSSRDAFERRGESFLQNARMEEFAFGDRRLSVCRLPLTAYVHRSFAQFLGLRQPQLDASPDALRDLLAHFPDDRPCALGPIRYYRAWEQPDGAPLDLSPAPELSITTYHSPSLCVLAAARNRLLQTGTARAILLETPRQ